MSYYVLPKNNNKMIVSPSITQSIVIPYVSYSFLHYYLDIKRQIIEMFVYDSDLSDNTFEDAIRIINPYEFIFSKVPGSVYSVSKLKPNSNLFYDLYEILNNLSLLESHNNTNICSLHVSDNAKDSIDCYEMFREGYNDHIVQSSAINIDEVYNTSFDYIFFETNTHIVNDYFISIVQILILILRHQKYGGHTVIKIKDMLHKPVIDSLYLLSSLYDKVYIAKPNTNNITSLDRYIVCRSFQHDESSKSYLKLNSIHLIILLKRLDNKNIASILSGNIPYHFKNKIDDLNIIIGQQQIEALDQIVAIFKNKNKFDKIENIKKSNIQKSVSWCEKYNIPCNKFTEKTNLFLPMVNEH